MKAKIILQAILVGVIALLICAGCGCGKTEGSTTAKKLRVGMVTFPGYAPLYLAREKKLFNGVDVDLVRIESISDLRAAMKAGRIDMYLATYDIFQSAANEVPPGVAFLAVDESHGADGIAVDAGITSVKDLKGKPVAAEPGFPPYFVLQYALHEAGMTLKDVKFKDMASQDAGTAFAASKFPAVGTYEPYLSKAVQARKGSRVLLSSKDTPSLIVDFVFANEDLVANNKEDLKKFAQGWFDALAYIEKNKDESMSIMGKEFGVSKEEMMEFQSGVTWLDLARNKQLFDKSAKGNAFETYDLVGKVLDANGARQVKTSSGDKLNAAVITSFGQ